VSGHGRVKDGGRPSPTPLVPLEPDVVRRPEPPGTGYRIPSKRRRRRWLMAFLVGWALVVAAVGFAWYQFGRLSHELQVSNGRVGGPVQRALTPAPGGAPRQTTLIAGMSSRGHVGGAVILTRIDSTRHAVEILTVPSTVFVTDLQRLRDVLRVDGVPRAIDLFERHLGLPVNHVLLVQLAQAGSIVSSLGGITIMNPAPVRYDVAGGSGVFPAGRLALSGRTVQWYLHPTTRPLTTVADVRQAAVTRGVTDKLVHLTTPAAITDVGRTISHSFTTDLSPDPVLGLVAARLRARTLVDCRMGAGADLSRAGRVETIAGFKTAARRGSCTLVPLETTLPAADVAATIIATLVTHGGSSALYWLVVATIAIWGIAACAWILMLPAVRGVRRLRLPHIGRTERPHRPYGRRHRRRRRMAEAALRVVSVPASIGLGMLIAHLLS
jgi:anionic cell wall polymer biosynthesis LytR-Cps2A-Psr (LCP) family protein